MCITRMIFCFRICTLISTYMFISYFFDLCIYIYIFIYMHMLEEGSGAKDDVLPYAKISM